MGNDHGKKISDLVEQLNKIVCLRKRKFEEIADLLKPGVYLVYDEEELLYVGKTTRKGNKRLREMISDYRSHTFNNKLVKGDLEKRLGRSIKSLGKKNIASLMRDGGLTIDILYSAQKEVNETIKSKYRFCFFEIGDSESTGLEHFAIAVCSPKYND